MVDRGVENAAGAGEIRKAFPQTEPAWRRARAIERGGKVFEKIQGGRLLIPARSDRKQTMKSSREGVVGGGPKQKARKGRRSRNGNRRVGGIVDA